MMTVPIRHSKVFFLLLWFGSPPGNTVRGFSRHGPIIPRLGLRQHQQPPSLLLLLLSVTSTTRLANSNHKEEEEKEVKEASSPYWFAKVKAGSTSSSNDDPTPSSSTQNKTSTAEESHMPILGEIPSANAAAETENSKDPTEKDTAETDAATIPDTSTVETTTVSETKHIHTNTIQEQEEEEDKEVAPIVCEPEEGGYVPIIFPFRIDTDVGTEELQSREKDRPMFTPAVRADVYNVLRHPNSPTTGAPAPNPSSSSSSSPFQAILLAKQQNSQQQSGFDTYSFCDRALFEKMIEQDHPQLKQYTVLGNDEMMQAVACIGKTTPRALAITKAFEAYLSQTAWTWGDEEASGFSVEFLIAFGNELSTRLDINHRIRSTKLSDEEVDVLSNQPFCNYVQPEAMQVFQNKWK
jgi:hypothetical protein